MLFIIFHIFHAWFKDKTIFKDKITFINHGKKPFFLAGINKNEKEKNN